MKRIPIIGLILWSSLLLAQAGEIILLDTGLSNHQYKQYLFKIKVHDDRKMNVEVRSIPRPFEHHSVPYATYNKTLNLDSFAAIKEYVSDLAQAKLTVLHSDIVCEMLPQYYLTVDHLYLPENYDRDTDSFLGLMELVDGPHGCWLENEHLPESEYAQSQAVVLKIILRTLALDLVGNHL